MADQRHTGFHNRALMRGSQHHAAGHVRDLSFCLKDPSEIELIENGLYVLASVQASMNNSQYQTKLSLYQYEPLSRKIKIRYAECTCVAGQVRHREFFLLFNKSKMKPTFAVF